MQLKDYQNQAVGRLFAKASESLRYVNPKSDDREVIVFKAPTGSGKTIMMAEFLSQLTQDDEFADRLAFVWAAPRQLHTQSREKLTTYFANTTNSLRCSEFNGLENLQINSCEVLFLNWESINRTKKNLLMKENERDHNLGTVIDNTLAAERIIVLIIDECHHSAKTKTAQGLIADLKPTLTIEVSATPPALTNNAELVRVRNQQVIAEGMIKKEMIINAGFTTALDGDNAKDKLANGTNAFVLKTALKKRNELADAFVSKNCNINPLLLIQLPNADEGEEKIKEDVAKQLKRENITVENGKLSIYLSEGKENLENVARNDCEVEVMLFKQGIALGWDCPRAQIMVLFRETKKIESAVQTLGRIMRMPEPHIGHYENEELNIAYVFSNMSEMKLFTEVADDYVRIQSSERVKTYREINLHSCYHLRNYDATRLNAKYKELFLLAAGGLTFADNKKAVGAIKLDACDVDRKLIGDKLLSVLSTNEKIKGEVPIMHLNHSELQLYFDEFIKDHLSVGKFQYDKDSVAMVRGAIYDFFEKQFQMTEYLAFAKIAKLVPNENNRDFFINAMREAVAKYLKTYASTTIKGEVKVTWEVPNSAHYDDGYQQCKAGKCKKSVMQPFYYQKLFKPEEEFIKLLEKSGSVKWWYKNSDRGKEHFAVPYNKNENPHLFYVDFVVQFTNGKVGLFDTKSGFTIDVAKEKSDGLLSYIKKENKKDKNLMGGLVTPANSKNYKHGWKIYTGKGAKLNSEDLSNWEVLDLF